MQGIDKIQEIGADEMEVTAHSYFGYTSGASQHAENFFNALEKKGVTLHRCNLGDGSGTPAEGIQVILAGVQEFPDVIKRVPPGPKVAFIAWESTKYPDACVEALRGVEQLWVPSGWQKEASDKQLIPLGFSNDFVRVVHEGVDASTFFPGTIKQGKFRYMIFGRWESRKATMEMIQHWIAVAPKDTELLISVDNSFPVDQYRTTEERLAGYGLEDKRIKVIHFPPKDEYVRYLQEGHVLLNVSRSEGWGLPILEGMASGIPVVCTDWSGNTEFSGSACNVIAKKLIAPFNVYGVPGCPGEWCEPDWKSYRWWIKELYDHYDEYRDNAVLTSVYSRADFSWEKAADQAIEFLGDIKGTRKIDMPQHCLQAGYEIDRSRGAYPVLVPQGKSVFVIGCAPDSTAKMQTLIETMAQIKSLGYKVIVSTNYSLPAPIQEISDYALYDHDGGDPIQNAIRFCDGKWERIHHLDYDIEVDLPEFLRLVSESTNPVVSTGDASLFSGRLEFLKGVIETGDWSSAAEVSLETSKRHCAKGWQEDRFECHFVEGAYLNIAGLSNREYMVTYHTPEKGNDYQLLQKVGMWSRPKTKFYQDWTITAHLANEEMFRHKIDLSGKRVLIQMGSKALGDTVAWVGYFSEFARKYNCHVIASTWWRNILDMPEIEIVAPGTQLSDLYASYEVGCFDNDPWKNKSNWRDVPMQQIATDILGLEYTSIKPRIKKFKTKHPVKGKYFCFSEFSTMQAKLWNRPDAWQELIDKIAKRGYRAVSISAEPTELKNVERRNNQSIEDTIAVLSGAEFYVGLGSGPSWLAWALDLPVVMISGFSEPFTEFPNPYRVINNSVCHGCFSDSRIPFDRGWEWAPCIDRGAKEVYECTKSITPAMVMRKIVAIEEAYGHKLNT